MTSGKDKKEEPSNHLMVSGVWQKGLRMYSQMGWSQIQGLWLIYVCEGNPISSLSLSVLAHEVEMPNLNPRHFCEALW